MRRRPRVGVVLGAGGVVGGAWMAGALAAISTETGWEPGSADVIIGTSAGAVMASLLASGMPASRLVPRAAAPDPEWPLRDLAMTNYTIRPTALPRPGSVPLALTAFGARGSWARSVPVLAALSPRGRASTIPISSSVRRELAGRRWPDHRACWIVVTEYRSGRRVIFGRDHVAADIATAVAASCAIPGYFRPVTIDGVEYVDGGVSSPTNADLATCADLDLVLCLNPLGRRTRRRSRQPTHVLEGLVRELASRQLEAEVAQLMEAGVAVEILSPGNDELELMSSDAMDSRSCIEVGFAALARVRQHLRSQGQTLGARLASSAA